MSSGTGAAANNALQGVEEGTVIEVFQQADNSWRRATILEINAFSIVGGTDEFRLKYSDGTTESLQLGNVHWRPVQPRRFCVVQ